MAHQRKKSPHYETQMQEGPSSTDYQSKKPISKDHFHCCIEQVVKYAKYIPYSTIYSYICNLLITVMSCRYNY